MVRTPWTDHKSEDKTTKIPLEWTSEVKGQDDISLWFDDYNLLESINLLSARSQIQQIWVISPQLKLWVAVARHNFTVRWLITQRAKGCDDVRLWCHGNHCTTQPSAAEQGLSDPVPSQTRGAEAEVVTGSKIALNSLVHVISHQITGTIIARKSLAHKIPHQIMAHNIDFSTWNH